MRIEDFGSTEEKVTVHYKNTCPVCGSVDEITQEIEKWAVNIIPSGEFSSLCSKCKEIEDIKQKKLWVLKNIEEKTKKANIPEDFCKWDKDKGNNELARWIRDNNTKSLYISGVNNACKTRATTINLFYCIRDGLESVRFIRFSELAAKYSSICKSESENAFSYILDVLNTNILLIDDVGKRRITETAGEMLYEIFDRIYSGDSNCLIWITANCNLSELNRKFENKDIGDAVVSRIDRMIEDGKMLKKEIL